jgi:hypothetical protein
MKINATTKIDDLLNQYPFLEDFLVTVSPKFKNLKNPIMRKTIGKVASLSQIAAVGGIPLNRLLESLVEEIARHTVESVPVKPLETATHGEILSDPNERQEALKSIIKDLHAGENMEVLKQRFGHLIQGVEASEIASMEQALMNEGLPAEEIKKLCDVHVEIFKDALEEKDLPKPPAGHPVHTFMKENRATERIISQISMVVGKMGHPPNPKRYEIVRQDLEDLLGKLADIDIHYSRKENQLFPMLEAHHFTGPSQVMWSIHDDIRADLKKTRDAFDRADLEPAVSALKEATQAIRDMIYKEEHILYPASLDMLSSEEWIKMKQGEADIGYAWVKPDKGWPEADIQMPEIKPAEPVETVKDVSGALGLDTGRMTLEQINLMLKHLPVDLTFVDATDQVAYYSEGLERIFPRSPAIIGREVRNCHPPKSVHIVNKILDEFKSGSKDTAEFWLELKGRFIYIRYFAVRNSEGTYQGTLEVSQDLTKIRKLTGEKRLLE